MSVRHSRVEILESRRLLSTSTATPQLLLHQGSVWTIDATAQDDVINVEVDPTNSRWIEASVAEAGTGYVTVAQPVARRRVSISRIVINGGAGDDTINVNLPPRFHAGVFVYGGDGNDTISGGAERDHIYAGAGNDTIAGGGGHDLIYATDNDSVTAEAKQVVHIEPTGVDPVVPPNMPVTPATFAGAVDQFASNLYAQLRADDPGQNIFFSPYSIASAFAMVYLGANGQTRQQMAETLGFPSDNQKLLSEIAADLSFAPSANSGATISQANGVWTQPGAHLNPSYISSLQSAFGAAPQQADFTNPDTVNQINQWVANHTNNKITQLFSSLNPHTVLTLVNAVYFDSTWASVFDPSMDTSQPFTSDAGSVSTANFMHQTSGYDYYENNNLQMIEMPYVDGDYEMTIVLPKSGGLASIDSSLTPANLAAWSAAAKQTQVQLSLPTFTMQTNINLVSVLQQMGITDAFNASTADFSGISSEPLVISQAVHQAYVKVDEQGTEATGVTGITVVPTVVVGGGPVVFNANHPFYVAINDIKTGATLFSGAMIDPGQ